MIICDYCKTKEAFTVIRVQAQNNHELKTGILLTKDVCPKCLKALIERIK